MFLSFFLFFLFFLFFFHPSRWNFFDEKYLKNGNEEVQPRVLRKVTAFQRKKTTDDDVKICRFLSIFFS